MKAVAALAVVVVIGVLVAQAVGDVVRESDGRTALSGPSVPAGTPAQVQSIIGSLGAARTRGVRAALHMSSSTGDADVPAPFADRGKRRRIAAVRRAIRRTLRKHGSRLDRTRVVAWQGVFVAGDRAVAVADVERTYRSSRHGESRTLPLRRMAFGMLADHGWQLVSTR
jgi:hypothetical protein